MTRVKRYLFLSLFSFVFLGNHVVFAQDTVKTQYYKEEYSSKEVSVNKARYARYVTKFGDSAISGISYRLTDRVILSSETYCGEEPCGEWVRSYNEKKHVLNYNFSLNYTDTSCNSNPLKLEIANDNDSLHYKAPTLSLRGRKVDLYYYLGSVLEYPQRAKEMGRAGKVIVMVRISSNRMVSSVGIMRATDIDFAKEVSRVFREMKFDTPPTLNGVPQDICYFVPVKFTLD